MINNEEYRKMWLQIQETERRIERAKLKRNIIAILCFAVAYFALFYSLQKPEGWNILGDALVAIVLAAIHFLVHTLIFSQLFRINNSENSCLESLKKELSELSDKP